MMELVITPTGTIRCIHSDTLNLRPLGRVEIRRASHVEPTEGGDWTADLSPVNGPVLGPFDTRTAALAAETTWLKEHWLENH